MSRPPNVYGDHVPWEIPVQIAARDFLGTNDIVFDVGANIGGLTIAFARMVSGGRVHAFEANPDLIPIIRNDLAANSVQNVKIVPRAAWSKSHEHLSLYIDDSYYASASSLITSRAGTRRVVGVETVTLDDYTMATNEIPAFVKLDVEGAEAEVLRGATRLLEAHSPAVILEYYAGVDMGSDPIMFLERFGYSFYDANLYIPVSRPWYLANFDSPPQVNVIAVPARLRKRYADVTLRKVHEIEVHSRTTRPFPLPRAGRYRIDVAITEEEDASTGSIRVVTAGGEQLAYYEAPVSHLRRHSCSSMVVDIKDPVSVRATLTTPGRSSIGTVTVYAIDRIGQVMSG